MASLSLVVIDYLFFCRSLSVMRREPRANLFGDYILKLLGEARDCDWGDGGIIGAAMKEVFIL